MKMSETRKTVISIIVIAALVLTGAGGYLYYHFVEPGSRMGHEVKQAQIRLLCETDHQVLLEACRELSRRYVNGDLDANEALQPSRLPEVIAALRPNSVTIARDGVVNIGMYGGWWPLGVRAYPEDYPKHSPPFRYGDRMLLEGLWYFEDGYSAHPDAYDRKIDELLSKCGKLKVE